MAPRQFLVVDQDPQRRDELVALLRQAGYHAAAASNGSAAAEAIGAEAPNFDAVLLDLALPGLNLSALRDALASPDSLPPDSLEAAERRHLALVLRYTAGNKRKAAHLLGISRSTLLNKVRKYRLEPS